MKKRTHRLSVITQNVIIGAITGIMVGYNLRIFFLRIGGEDLIWILIFALGPVIGFLSGKERKRIEKLKKEKTTLEENLSKIQVALERSAKKYRLLVERASDAIFLTTAEGEFLLFNEATCLLSGYEKGELKKMNLSQLQFEKNEKSQDKKAWLDNGICRYQERWKNKNGGSVVLEINAKWIQFSGHRLILHVGRDILRRIEGDREEVARDIRRFQEDKLVERERVHRAVYGQILNPLTNTTRLMKYLMREYPKEEGNLSEVLSQWGKARKVLQELSSKNTRILTSSVSRWNLNEILEQEIHYLKTSEGSKNLVVQTSFAPNLPSIYGFGRDFTLAFGTVLKAAWESLKSSDQGELFVSTRTMVDHIMVEIRIPSVVPFEDHLCRAIDPFFKGSDSEDTKMMEMGLLVCQILFDSFGAKLDVGTQNKKGTIIRIRVTVPQEKTEVKRKAPIEISEDDVLII